MTKFTSSRPDPNEALEREIAEEFEPEAAVDQSTADVVQQLDVAGEAITLEPAPVEDAGPDERIAELELALDSLGAALDAVNDRVSAWERIEARISALEARTRDATINADIVSLQGKVAGLEENVGAKQAPALEELRTRVDALEART